MHLCLPDRSRGVFFGGNTRPPTDGGFLSPGLQIAIQYSPYRENQAMARFLNVGIFMLLSRILKLTGAGDCD